MSNRDLTSDLTSKVAQKATISTNTTTSGTDIDTAQTSQGVNFLVALTAWTDGSYVFNIQESDVGGGAGYTDVATANIIGTKPTLAVADVAGGTIARVGAFGTKRYVRCQLISTGVTTGATALVVAQNVANIKP
jgi:hypothetical protein